MRNFVVAIGLLFCAAPAFAQGTPPVFRAGDVLRGPSNVRLGTIDSVLSDGSVRLILDSKFVTVPASTISVIDGKPITSLSKRDAAKLR